MSRNFETPIVSIYDLMVERHRKLTFESESKAISMGAQKMSRGKVEEEATTNAKIWPKKPRTTKAVRQMPSSLTLESESYRPLSSITATHMTKKHTIVKVPPPAKKEVISKLVEKMSKVCGRAKAADVVPQPAENSPKQESGIQRKGRGTLGTSRNKQKPNKSNADRRPLSPRKAERGPRDKGERGPKDKAERGPKEKEERGPKDKAERGPKEKEELVPKEKTMLKSMPKLPKTSGHQVRSVRESAGSFKPAPLSTDRRRI